MIFSFIDDDRVVGTLYAITAFTAWGILPIFWKLLLCVSSLEVTAHRIMWAFIFVTLILIIKGKGDGIKQALLEKANRKFIFMGALLIGTNWFVFIYAVSSNQLVEASMGYYINPLLSIILGLVVLKERLNLWQLLALLLAFGAVLVMTFQYGKFPWIAIVLATSFALYGLVKKLSDIDSMISISGETMMLTPLAAVLVMTKASQGVGAFGNASAKITTLLIFSGIVTGLPLFWFAKSAKKIPLSRIGFIQYLAPTFMLLLGVILYKEPFTRVHRISFGLIWTALALYSLSKTHLLARIESKYLKLLKEKTGL